MNCPASKAQGQKRVIVRAGYQNAATRRLSAMRGVLDDGVDRGACHPPTSSNRFRVVTDNGSTHNPNQSL